MNCSNVSLRRSYITWIFERHPWMSCFEKLFETGHPWVTFKDPCNIRSPQGHVGTVHSSNLCTEITLNTNEDEIAISSSFVFRVISVHKFEE